MKDNKKKLVTLATATLAVVAAAKMTANTDTVKADALSTKTEEVKSTSSASLSEEIVQKESDNLPQENKNESRLADSKESIASNVNNTLKSKALNQVSYKTENNQVGNTLDSTNIKALKVNKLEKSNVANDVKKEIYLNQYTVPTGVDQNGNYTGFNRIHNKNNNNPATITVKLHNNGKLSYSLYGSEDTYIDSESFNSPTTFDGYEYDDTFTKQYDPARYLLANHNGKISLDKIADQQSYAIFYKSPEQIIGQKSILDLDKLNKNNSYDSRFDWYDQDTGYYLGSTDMNDYSMGTEGHLFDSNLNIPSELRNNTDFIVKAPTGYRFMVVVKDGKLVTDKSQFTKNEFTAINEFNYDDPLSGHHPYLDMSYSDDLYHQGIFHANEWAHIQQFDPTQPQNYCANNLHIFKVFVRHEGDPASDKEPTNGVFPSHSAVPLEKENYTLNEKYNQLIGNNKKSKSTNPEYRQALIAVNDDLTGKNIGVAAIPLNILQNDEEIPLLQLTDYVTGKSILDSTYGISTWQNINDQLTLVGDKVNSNKIHIGNYYVDTSFNHSNNHVDSWGNGRLQLWVHKITQWDTPVSDAKVSFIMNPKMKTLKFVDQDGKVVDWATKTIYGVDDIVDNKNVVDWNIKVPKGYSLLSGATIPDHYAFTSTDLNKYDKNGQLTIDNNPILVKVIKHKDSDADIYTPKARNIEITNEGNLVAAWQVIENIDQLPENASYLWENSRQVTEDFKKVGNHTEYVKVTYSDGSFDSVAFNLNVKKAESQIYTPKAKSVTITAGEGIPAAWSLISNIGSMPVGTGYNWDNGNQVLADSKKSGTYTEYVKVTYSDGSVSRQGFVLTVNDPSSEAVKYVPTAKSTTMTAGESLPAAWKLITNLGVMPAGASYDWSNVDQITSDSKKPGTYTEYVRVTYSDGSVDETKFVLTVNAQGSMASEYTPKAKSVTITAGEGIPAAWSLISNIGSMPVGTGYNWDNGNQVLADSKKSGTYTEYVKVTYSDGSVSRQGFVLTVNDPSSEAVKYVPTAKSTTMTAGESLPAAWKLITNLGVMPAGASYDWSNVDQITSDSKKPGTYTEYVRVTYSDGSVDLASFTLIVK